jgi:hypothetical protein
VYGPKRPWTAAILFKGDEMTDSNHAPTEPVHSEDVAAIQNDETLTPADRVHLIANQVAAEEEEDEVPDNN